MKRYIRASFSESIPSWLAEDKWAIKALNEKGIDLHNATFSDTRTGKAGDNYTIYLVEGTRFGNSYRPFVWIPGIYNDDQYVEAEPEYNYRAQKRMPKSKAIKYMAKRDINFLETVYVNIDSNRKARKDRYVDPRHDKYGNYAGQRMIPEKTQLNWDTNEYEVVKPAHWSEKGTLSDEHGRYVYEEPRRDKSGYVIPNPKDRLEKFYNTKEGRDRRVALIRNKLDSTYQELETAQEDVFNAIVPKGTRNDYRKYKSLYDYLDDAVGRYEAALKDFEYIEKSGWEDESDWFSSHSISEALSYLDEVKYYINKIYSNLK